MDQFTQLVLTLALLCAGFLFVIPLARWLWVGAALVTGIALLDSLTPGKLLESVNIGTVSMWPMDLAALALLGAMLLKIGAGHRACLRDSRWRASVALLLLLGITCLWGVSLFGLEQAVSEFRLQFHFLVTTIYAASFTLTPRQWQKALRTLLWCGLLMVIITCTQWFLWLTGYATFGRTTFLVPRVQNASIAIFIGQTGILALYGANAGYVANVWRWFGLVSLPVVILLQHRTVWVSAIIAAIVTFWKDGRLRRATVARVGLAVGVCAIISWILFGELLLESLQYALQSTGPTERGTTAAWRIEGWEILFQEYLDAGPLVNLIGMPFGTGFGRLLETGEVTVSPHNFYLRMLLRGGIVSLLVLLAIYVSLIRPALTMSWRDQPPARRALFSVLIFQLVYCIAYAPDPEQGILLGIIIAAYRQHHPKLAEPSQGRPIASSHVLSPK